MDAGVIRERLLSQIEAIEERRKRLTVKRELEERIKKVMDTELVKVVTGPRRAGKTSLLIRLLPPDDTYYVNFDDELLSRLRVEEMNKVMKALMEEFGKRGHILLDEVQNIEGWELFVNRLQREGYNVFVTGSNSRLLSHELATHLTGRVLEFTLYPYSFREYLSAINHRPSFSERGVGELQRHLKEYLIYGGYPEILNLPSEIRLDYIKGLINQTLYVDIIKRYELKLGSSIEALFNVLVNQVGNPTNKRRLAHKVGVSHVTVEAYLRYLENAYLLLPIYRFSNKAHEVVTSHPKYYAVDTSYITLEKVGRAEEVWRYSENAVAMELLRRGKVYYTKAGDYEVDFYDGRTLYQVTEAGEGSPALSRELRALIEASEVMKKKRLAIITRDYEDTKRVRGKEVYFIPLWRWLLERPF